MRMRFYVVMLTSNDGAKPFPVFLKEPPSLEEMLDNSESFSAAWKGKLPERNATGEVVSWTEPEDASHAFSVSGPYVTPRTHDTFVAIRPGALFGRVALQAVSKSAARTLLDNTFGPVRGTILLRMLPFETRILAPLM